VSGLKIPLSALERGEHEIDITVPEGGLRPPEAKALEVGPVHIQGRISRVEPRFVFIGTLTGEYLRQCDRCLAPVQVPFELEVIWPFEPGPAGEAAELAAESGDGDLEDNESDTVYFDGGEIDLAAPAWEELVLSAPLKTLCEDDCAGLCPHCGANRNTAPCHCGGKAPLTEFGNSGFSGLAALFPELDPKRSKE